MKPLSTQYWVQVDGDRDPATYGGTLARLVGDYAIELLEIQPVLEYVSDVEAQEVAFPFGPVNRFGTSQI